MSELDIIESELMRQGGAPSNPVNQITAAREMMEVQAMVAMAKRFPRSVPESIARIKTECSRLGLAEKAIYSYPRGGQKVEGPSIRLAETIARNWGNIQFGQREIDQDTKVTLANAYAWDLETNTRQEKLFYVPHERHTKKGVQVLHDHRDIYELVANYGARRMRNCILAVIPGDVIDFAVNQCKKTLLDKSKGVPREDRIRKMVLAFDEFGVTTKMIEKFLGHSLEGTDENQLVKLLSVYNSIKDGVGKKTDFFDLEGNPDQTKQMHKDAATESFDKQQKDYVTKLKTMCVSLQKKGLREADVLKHLDAASWTEIEGWGVEKLKAAVHKLAKAAGSK